MLLNFSPRLLIALSLLVSAPFSIASELVVGQVARSNEQKQKGFSFQKFGK